MGAVLKKDIEEINSDSSNYNPNYPFEPKKVNMNKKTRVYGDSLNRMFSKLSKKKRE